MKRRRRARLGLIVVPALVAVLVLGVVGVGGSAADPPQRERYRLAVDARFAALARTLKADRRRAERRRQTHKARANRNRSRFAFGNAPAGKALKIARAKFGRFIDREVWTRFPAPPGNRVERFTGTRSLLLSNETDGSRVVVQSDVPLATEGPNGDLVSVDLGLEEDSRGLRSRNPIVPVRFFEDARRGLNLERSELSVRIASAVRSRAQIVSDKAFYANVLRDTDYWAVPADGGASLEFQLRSQASPEEISLAFDLPASAELRLVPSSGAAEIVREGKLLALVDPPAALDADGRQVAVRYAVDGPRLVVHVEHRGRDVRYPLVVDPMIQEGAYWEDFADPATLGTRGWQTHSSRGDSAFAWALTNWTLGKGLWVIARPGYEYSFGDYAEWYLRPERWGIKVRGVVFQTSTQLTSSCVQAGIWGPTDYVGDPEGDRPYRACKSDRGVYKTVCAVRDPAGKCPFTGGNEGSHATVALMMWWDKHTPPAEEVNAVALNRVNVLLGEDEPPSLGGIATIPRRPWADSDAYWIGGHAEDSAIGMGTMWLSRRPDLSTATQIADMKQAQYCEGTRFSPCPQSLDGGWAAFSTGFPEGETPIWVNALDYLGNGANRQLGTFRIDRSPPTLDTARFAGALWAARGRWVDDGRYDLVSYARDSYSGVKAHELQVDSVVKADDLNACDATDAQPCKLEEPSLPLWWDTAGSPEGERQIKAVASDPLDHHSEPSVFTVKLDRTKPYIVPGTKGGSLSRPGRGSGPRRLKLTARDDYSGVQRVELLIDDANDASDQPRVVDSAAGTCTSSGCGHELSRTLEWHPGPNDPEDANVTVRILDQLDHPYTETTRSRADGADPTLKLSGPLYGPVIARGRRLDMEGRDSDSGVARFDVWLDPANEQTPGVPTESHPLACDPACKDVDTWTWTLPPTTTGKHRILVRATDAAERFAQESFEVTVVDLLPPADSSKLGLEQWWDYYDTPAGGGSRVFVNAETGNAVWHSVPIVNPGRGLSTAVNLTYNSQDRGGSLGAQLGNNLIVDAGATDLSNALPKLSYGEAGVGFSVAVSGPTRLNEPLGGVVVAEAVEEGQSIGGLTQQQLVTLKDQGITLTDSDGTVHTFRSGQNGWISPPGLNMKLRRYQNDDPVNPAAVVPRKWAMTRPDGVTHFFDSLGYLTSSEDRNGNALRYVYEYYDAFTGEVETGIDSQGNTVPTGVCQGRKLFERSTTPEGTPVLCAKRVREVIPPAGQQKLMIDYVDHGTSLLGRQQELPIDVRVRYPGLIGGIAGRISRITDAAGRHYDFAYDPTGYLQSFTEDSTGSKPRITNLVYEPVAPGLEAVGQDRQLTEVVEPAELGSSGEVARAERKTVIRYVDPADRHGGPPAPTVQPLARPREVCGITKRNSGETTMVPQQQGGTCRTRRSDLETTFDYAPANGDTSRTFKVNEVLQRAQGVGASAVTATTVHELDTTGRPTAVAEPLAGTASRRTALQWNSDNKVTSVEEAAGTSDASLTEFEYTGENATGVLTAKRTYPNYVSAQSRGTALRTAFTYQYSSGLYRSTASGVNDGDAYVADLVRIEKPRPGTGAEFRIEQRPHPTRTTEQYFTGNVVETWPQPGRSGASATTAYDSHGQVISETDEVGQMTLYGGRPASNAGEYPDFHVTGQPERVTDPGPDGRVWRYSYDAVGNVTHVVDPRGNTAAPAQDGKPFTTTLGYDGFDRLVSEQIPKLSTSADPLERFIQKSRVFDRNGNVTSVTDGAGSTTLIDSTPMDLPSRVQTPGREGRFETTRYLYDDADRLIARSDPLGAGVDLASVLGTHEDDCTSDSLPSGYPSLTMYCLDLAGRRLAEVRTSAGSGDPVALITAFAFDARDNVVGVIDPARTVQETGAPWPVKAAVSFVGVTDPSTTPRRFTYEYDKQDRLVGQREHLTEYVDGDRVPGLRTQYVYDDNGNRTEVHPPRAFQGAGGPDHAFSTHVWFDQRDAVVAVRNPRGCTSYARRADGRVESITAPRGNNGEGQPEDRWDYNCSLGDRSPYFTTRLTYDETGNVTSRSIPYAPNQYGRPDSEFDTWKVIYARDKVGNATTITDPRGSAFPEGSPDRAAHTFSNTYYDNGALRMTERPSFYQLDWGTAGASPDAGKRFAEQASSVDYDNGVGGPQLSEVAGPSRNARSSASVPDLPSSTDAGNFGSVSPQDAGDMLPDAGPTSFAYDGEMRLTAITDAAGGRRQIDYDDAGRVTSKKWPFGQGSRGLISHDYLYDLNGNLQQYSDGQGNTSTFDYDGYDRRIIETAPAGRPGDPVISEITRFTYDQNGNLTYRSTPENGNRKFAFTYDSADRLLTEANPANDTWGYEYDAAGNVTLERSPLGQSASATGDCATRSDAGLFERGCYETRFEYTNDDLVASARNGLDHRTDYAYDDNGNLASVDSPGAAVDPDEPELRRIVTILHDGRDLPWAQTVSRDYEPGDEHERERERPRTTLTEYDPNGNVRRVVNPSGVDPRTITHAPYGADVSSASPSMSQADQRTATWHATLRVYDEADQLTQEWLPRSAAGDSSDPRPDGQEGAETGGDPRELVRDFSRSSTPSDANQLRRVTSISAPHLAGENTAPRVFYSYYSNGWLSGQTDEKVTDTDSPGRINVSYEYDGDGNQTRWETRNADSAEGRIVSRIYNRNGTLALRRAMKTTGAADCTTRRQYLYSYNKNRSLTKVRDYPVTGPNESCDSAEPSGDTPPVNTTEITRDAAERIQLVNETWTTGRDTFFAYDKNGNVVTRKTDGAIASTGAFKTGSDGKTTTFSYDPLDRELSNVVKPISGPNRTTTTTWWDSDEMRSRTTQNGTEVRRFYDTHGDITQKERDPRPSAQAGVPDPPTDVQIYKYDVDGNRTRDERGTHVFNPRGQTVSWHRADDAKYGAKRDKVVDYTRTPSGDIATTTDSYTPQGAVGSTKSWYCYRGERLRWTETRVATQAGAGIGDVDCSASTAPAAPAGVQTQHSDYFYDALNSVVEIRHDQSGAGPNDRPAPAVQTPPNCQGLPARAADTPNVTQYCFDEFERMLLARGAGITREESFVYDGFDRRDFKRAVDGSVTRTRDLSYVGTSRMLSREIDSQGETKTYDYDSAGRRLGQGRTPTPASGAQPAPEAFRAYAVDANGSVEGLEDGNGVIPASDRYVYDPYGENDKVPATNEKNDGDQGLSADAKENPFRFEGFYFDSGIKTYDMQARVYRPDSGRFLSQDRFEAAAGDQALQTDPLTQNRYAFAGGNPVTNVEFDGHRLDTQDCNHRQSCVDQINQHNANANRASALNRDVGGHRVDSSGKPRPPTRAQIRVLAQERYYSNFRTQQWRVSGTPFCQMLPNTICRKGRPTGTPFDLVVGFACGLPSCGGDETAAAYKVGGFLSWVGGPAAWGRGAVKHELKELLKEGGERRAGRELAEEGAERGAAKAPRFTQNSVSGAFRHGPFAGQRVADVAAGLRSGAISPSQLPIEVIRRDGALYALNNRSTLALRRGGIDPAKWALRDMTGNPALERKLSQRLADDGIPYGSDVIRVRGAGPNASAYR